MANAPPGAQAATLDIEGAYRTVPLKPDHKRYLVVFFEGFYYLDHNVPFGLASASGLQGEVADATIDILKHLWIDPAVKWVDDFTIFRFPVPSGTFFGISDGHPYSYAYDLSSVKQSIASLCIPWHKDKGQEFGDVFSYVGFEWDLPRKTVSVGDRKRLKNLAKLTSFLEEFSHSQAPKKRVERIVGSLSHLSFVYSRGCSRLPNLYDSLTAYKNDFHPRYLSSSALSDLRWWHSTLSSPQFYRSLRPKGPTHDYDIWVDASTDYGVGILWNGRWAAWHVVPGWKSEHRHIGWLEGVATEVAILFAEAMGLSGMDFLIRGDNQGVIGAFLKGACSNHLMNDSIRRSESILDLHTLSITLIYVNTKDNLADPISRGILPSADLRLPRIITLPLPISQYFYDV